MSPAEYAVLLIPSLLCGLAVFPIVFWKSKRGLVKADHALTVGTDVDVIVAMRIRAE